MPLLKWFACVVIIGWLLVGALDAWPQRADNDITRLADDVYLFRHQFHQAIFVTTPEGVIVTDPMSAEAASWLKAEIKKMTNQPIRYLVDSHHHSDHISGGSVFAD